jgi:hypothetical protein
MSFLVPPSTLTAQSALFLDLGRLDIAAKLRINGKSAGSLWKPPYRLEITQLMHAGVNQLEAEVTTLWPNRLIGDEQMPPENTYGPTDPSSSSPTGIATTSPSPAHAQPSLSGTITTRRSRSCSQVSPGRYA